MVGLATRGATRRGEITGLSQRSRNRLALVGRNVYGVTHLMTLTYPGEWLDVCQDGRRLKQQLNAFLMALRRAHPGIGYLWFLEFQRRGAPHLHIGVTARVDRLWLSLTWARVVGAAGEERRRHELAGTNVEQIRSEDGFARYVAKYASKWEQKVVPAYFTGVGRMWGCGGGLSLPTTTFEGQSGGEASRLLRVVRGLHRARSREAGLNVEDRGWRGWMVYNVGDALDRYIQWAEFDDVIVTRRL
jgi:hypothetical protein